MSKKRRERREEKKRRKQEKRRVRMEKNQDNGFNRASQGLHGALMGVLSNFRMSLTFRIALHYGWQLVRTFVATCLVMTLCYGIVSGLGMMRETRLIARTAPGEGGVYTQQEIQNRHAEVVMIQEELPAASHERNMELIAMMFQRIGRGKMGVAEASDYAPQHYIIVYFALEGYVRLWAWLMAAVALCDVLRMMYFIRHNHRLDKRVLAPIREITDMAATLSASNLSNRINLAGTKNELRDLAVVINTMLDRIELSYNSQKQFVSDASHELRTPIAVIQGYVNMLKRWGKDDPEVLGEGLTAISQETTSMKELVENLLFLARHDKKTLMMEMSVFDPMEIMEELHKEAEMVTPEDHFELTPCEHCTISADRNMVKQVMRILLDNAVKYTPKGGTIRMGVAWTENGCTLSMSDNGPGIPKEELPKIFERFYRSDKARKAESGGHGLGLSIARIIVIAHGGKIRVRSKVGEGTTFFVDLPNERAE